MSYKLYFIMLVSLIACQNEKATLILYHGQILTMDSTFRVVQAIAIQGNKILEVGSSSDITQKYYHEQCEMIDLQGKFAMPGLIEGHGHYLSMGKSLYELDLLHTASWSEVLDSVQNKVQNTPKGEWIFGRGWHQEKWNDSLLYTVQGYPTNKGLDRIAPEHPVLLIHASGHALIANRKAMEHLSMDAPDPAGGRILRDDMGNAVGIFEENAMTLIKGEYNAYLNDQSTQRKDSLWRNYVKMAEAACLKYGITSFQDAGSSLYEIDQYVKYQRDTGFQIRLSVMLNDELREIAHHIDKFPIDTKNDHFKCSAIKAYADGALGSRGAWLLKPYNDQPNYTGQQVTSPDTLTSLARLAAQNQLQFCVHGIGDRANRSILDIVEKLENEGQLRNDHRWRIEHAQHIDPLDIPRFAQLGVIASVQTRHCTSDAPYVEERLGAVRAREGAYVWRSLLDAGAQIANGTDVPVEEINPFVNMYAAITRKSHPAGDAFFPKQCMTREEALKSYTIWNAYANFEEKIKGSLEPGKLADIVVTDQNLLTCRDKDLLHTKALITIVDGKIVYRR